MCASIGFLAVNMKSLTLMFIFGLLIAVGTVQQSAADTADGAAASEESKRSLIVQMPLGKIKILDNENTLHNAKYKFITLSRNAHSK